MNMTMVDIRPMHVCMRYRFVYMLMVVLPFAFPFVVVVNMMLVMLVPMGVGKPLMPVKVPVRFPVEKKYSR
jgi:hypothetical protein